MTEEELDSLEAGLAKGWSNARIAKAIGIGLSTLKRNYGPLLKRREEIPDKLQLALFATAARQALLGNMVAVRQLERMIEKDEVTNLDRRMRAAQNSDDGEVDEDPSARRMGKKEAAKEAAKTAGEGSDWGSDLLPGVMN